MRVSGLQSEVRSLYRQLLRIAINKTGKDSTLVDHVRKEFRDKAYSVKKNDFKTIEYALRQGQKQKKLMEMPGFRGVA